MSVSKGAYLVIPAADAELAAQAVGAGAVVHTCAVLGGRQGQLSPESALSPNHPSFSRVHILALWVVTVPR